MPLNNKFSEYVHRRLPSVQKPFFFLKKKKPNFLPQGDHLLSAMNMKFPLYCKTIHLANTLMHAAAPPQCCRAQCLKHIFFLITLLQSKTIS